MFSYRSVKEAVCVWVGESSLTLVLTEISRRWVVQGTDRLVTRRAESLDTLANKNIVLLARDGLISIGYTGNAYLGYPPIPTDCWMARKLARDESLQDDGEGAIRIGDDRPWPDVGQALLGLCGELGTELSSRGSDRPGSFQVVAAGWQWKTEGKMWNLARSRPIMWMLDHLGAPAYMRASYMPRDWGWERNRLHLSAVPRSNISDQRGKDLINKLAQTGRANESEDLVVDCLREISRENVVVGPHVMLTTIPHPLRSRMVHTRYVPSEQNTEEAGPAAFTPWVLTPSTVVAPTMFSEELEVPVGPYTFVFEGPSEPIIGEDGSIYLFRSQHRPEGS